MTQPLPHRWRALWVTLVAGFMTLLDVSIVAVALPSMQRELGATPASVQWACTPTSPPADGCPPLTSSARLEWVPGHRRT